MQDLLSKVKKEIHQNGRALFIVGALDENNNDLWIVTNDHAKGAKILGLPKQEDGSLTTKGATLELALQSFVEEYGKE